jgi:protein-tyrosine phosphatase
MKEPKLRVLMVCMGNICRSPTAAGVLRRKLEDAGLDDSVEVDSAGTHANWHKGEGADRRAHERALARGYDLSAHRARVVGDEDFARYDLILAMDRENIAALEERCPEEQRGKLRRLSEFGRRHASDEVPDPYYAGPAAFEHVLDLVEDACDGVVDELRGRL